jgi:CRP/FNR family cyclic AMP-dependent transcriptional regulator
MRRNSRAVPVMDIVTAYTIRPSLLQLAERGQQRRYRKGVVIISEGDTSNSLFVILSGRVKAYSVDDRDREITYGISGAGDTVGEMSLDGGPRSANVITLEPTVCAVVTREALLEHIKVHPEFALELLEKVIARARMATRNARNMALLDVYGRVVQLLESLAEEQPDGTRVVAERLTHAEIANRVGCSREMVSRLLKDLKKGSYLSAEDRGWRLAKVLPPHW